MAKGPGESMTVTVAVTVTVTVHPCWTGRWNRLLSGLRRTEGQKPAQLGTVSFYSIYLSQLLHPEDSALRSYASCFVPFPLAYTIEQCLFNRG